MGVKVITPPTLIDIGAGGIVTAADLRKHMRIAADGSEDELATSYLAAAHAQAEHYTGRPIGTQVLELGLDAFPAGAIELGSAVTDVASVKYMDAAGAEQTLSTSLYTLDDYGLECWVVPKVDTAWPDTQEAANAVKVRFTAGDVPAAVKSALLLLTTWLYENRGSEPGDVPTGIYSLLNTVKRWGV